MASKSKISIQNSMLAKRIDLQTDDEVLGKAYDPRIARRLLQYLAPQRKAIAFALILMVIGTLSQLAGPYLIKIALDSGAAAGDATALTLAVAGYLAVNLASWLTTRTRMVIMATAGQTIIYDLRAELFRHIHTLGLGFFSRHKVGRLITRVISDVGVMRELITWAVVAVANDVLTLIGLMLAMVALNWRLSLITFLALPLMGLITAVWRVRARDAYRWTRRATSYLTGVLAENIAGVRVVQSFSREALNQRIFVDEVNRENLNANIASARLSAIFFPTVDFIGSLAIGLVVWIGGSMILQQTPGQAGLTPGILVAFVLYIDNFFNPIRDLSQRYNTFQATMAAGERIFEVLDTEPEIADAPDAIELPPIKGAVEFDHVDFAYEDGLPILSDINLKVRPGQTIALVGETGAGKSTLVKLIGRFYDVSAGRITIDGLDVRSVTQESLRRQLGVVLQDPFLFDGTIADNIRYGRPDASDADVIAAAQAVDAHRFISTMPDGYDTEVEEGGAILSTGQRQLISFARELLADPCILILDEATSSVDTQTEQHVQAAMGVPLKDRTAFVIAHRLSTVVKADQIIVIDNGCMVERGTHAELLAMRGRYFRLYTMAFLDPVEASRLGIASLA